MRREVLDPNGTCSPGVHMGDVDADLRCTACRREVFASAALSEETTLAGVADLLDRHGAHGLTLTRDPAAGRWVAGVRGAQLKHTTASAPDPATALIKALQAFVEGW